MDKLSSKILQYMVDQGRRTSCFCSLDREWDSSCDVSIDQLTDMVNAGADDVKSAISYLEKKGLVEYRNLHCKSGSAKIAFHLTHTGLHYKEIKALDSRERLKERIFGFLSGVLVTVVGGLILAWLAQ